MKKSASILIRADREIKAMKSHNIDYSDIPRMTKSRKKTGRLYYGEFLEKLPPDILREMAERKLKEMKM